MASELTLGPLLRYAGESDATVWVETDAACEVEVLGHTASTFEIEGHHYALVRLTDLEPGKTYEIVVTTAGGLYRYKLGDRALVTSFLEETPCFRFVGRTGLVSDLRGEKLTDEFVASCIRRLNGNFTFAMLAPSIDSDPPYYTLFIEGDCRSSLAWEFESHLRENPHYANAVDLGQLGSVRLLRIAANAYEIYSDHLVRQGSRLGEIKPSALSMCSRWADRFPPLVV